MMNLEAVQPQASTSAKIPLGDPGTEATIARMRELIDAGVKNSIVHECAAFILLASGVRQFDFEGEARAIYLWVLRSIRFTRDIAGKETLHTPEEILRLGIGDCDDFTILLCSLLGTIGHKTRIVTISSVLPDEEGEQPFTHVFPEVWIAGEWVAADAARREPGFGKTPRRYTRKRIWSIYADEYVDVQGLNAYGVGYDSPQRRWRNRNAMSGYRGMGDAASEANQLVPELTTGTADIIAASRANPTNLFPTTSITGQGTPPAGYGAFTSPVASGFFGGVSTSSLLLIGVVGLFAVMLMRKR